MVDGFTDLMPRDEALHLEVLSRSISFYIRVAVGSLTCSSAYLRQRNKKRRITTMIGVYDYTVILTYLSLLSACAGTDRVHERARSSLLRNVFHAFQSGLCDAFDGRVARTKKNRTPLEKDFGVQIDSFSDLIAFGILPASIGVSLLRVSEKYADTPRRLAESGKLLWYPAVLVGIAMLYVLAAMIRLAYFNVTVEDRKRELPRRGRSIHRHARDHCGAGVSR